MPYLTILLVASVPLIVEWLLSSILPVVWHKPRWVVLPLAAGAVGWFVPMGILEAVPWAGQALAVFLGVFLGLLVAIGGHFRATFWSGPSDEELAVTGRRSVYLQGQARRR